MITAPVPTPDPSPAPPPALEPARAPLPPLSPEDRARFNTTCRHSNDLSSLAAALNLDETDLLAWLTSPHIQAWIGARKALLLDQHELVYVPLALATLAETIKTTQNPIEKRRAASALLRRFAPLPTSSSRAPRPPEFPRYAHAPYTPRLHPPADPPNDSSDPTPPAATHRAGAARPASPRPQSPLPYQAEIDACDRLLAAGFQQLQSQLAAPQSTTFSPTESTRAATLLAAIASTPPSLSGAHPLDHLTKSPVPPPPPSRRPSPIHTDAKPVAPIAPSTFSSVPPSSSPTTRLATAAGATGPAP